MKKLLLKSVLLLGSTLMFATSIEAACSCMCVNNKKQWVCANTYDVPGGWCGGPCYGNYKPQTEDLSQNNKSTDSNKSEPILASLDLNSKCK